MIRRGRQAINKEVDSLGTLHAGEVLVGISLRLLCPRSFSVGGMDMPAEERQITRLI